MENGRILTVDTVVVGSGAAGYSAACRLQEMGKKSVALVTEGVNIGTSRNTGSDKQTYYKLGLGGDAPDSVRQMAENLFALLRQAEKTADVLIAVEPKQKDGVMAGVLNRLRKACVSADVPH